MGSIENAVCHFSIKREPVNESDILFSISDENPGFVPLEDVIMVRPRKVESEIRDGALAQYEVQNKFSKFASWRYLPDSYTEKKREKKIRSAVVSRQSKREYQRFLETALANVEDKNRELQMLTKNLREEIDAAEKRINHTGKQHDEDAYPPDSINALSQFTASEALPYEMKSHVDSRASVSFDDDMEETSDFGRGAGELWTGSVWQQRIFLQSETTRHDSNDKDLDSLLEDCCDISLEKKIVHREGDHNLIFETSRPAPGAWCLLLTAFLFQTHRTAGAIDGTGLRMEWNLQAGKVWRTQVDSGLIGNEQ